MKILLNCSNLKAGGGMQVADSIACLLHRFTGDTFYVVLSSYMMATHARLKEQGASNIICTCHDIRNDFQTVVLGRDSYLDRVVEENQISVVLTVFGPSRWCPRVPHLSGFAMPHLVMPESPFFARMSGMQRMKWKLRNAVRAWSFRHSAHFFWTENPCISRRLVRLFKHTTVFTLSNSYNQIYDHPSQWTRRISLPSFDGLTCLSVSAYYPHKNFEIIIGAVRKLNASFPDLKVRFVLTFDEAEMTVPSDVRDAFVFVGRVDISECPNLYEQADIMFMPTLLECFTATYLEAMCMAVPIVTTDLEFARGLCGDAACYYSAVDPEAAAKAIHSVATDKKYAAQLIANGKDQLKKFDNSDRRAEKLMELLNEIAGRGNEKY